jgi:rhomboid family GlyGly-CTERM serine protease
MEVSKKRRVRKWMSNVLRQCQRCIGRLPFVTFFVCALAISFQLLPDLGGQMGFDRSAINLGEYWRLVTGHLAHWNADHMAWDVFMFALLGTMIERRNRLGLVATLLSSVAAISAAVWFGHAGVQQYRGLSGIDSALFTFGMLNSYDEARRAKQSNACRALTAMAMAFVGKILWELATGSTLFVDSSAAGFTPLPLVHAVGGCVGVLTWCGTKGWSTDRSRGFCVRRSAAGIAVCIKSPQDLEEGRRWVSIERM